jgi:hypothetical protein
VITQVAEDGWMDVVATAQAGGGDATVAAMPGERARTNLALLYGGTGRAPVARYAVNPFA